MVLASHGPRGALPGRSRTIEVEPVPVTVPEKMPSEPPPEPEPIPDEEPAEPVEPDKVPA